MDVRKLVAALSPVERKVLPVIAEVSSSEDIVKRTGLKDVEVMRALQWLENKRIITMKQDIRDIILLGCNGVAYREKGLPELRLLRAVADSELPLQEIKGKAGISDEELQVSLGVLRGRAAIELIKDVPVRVRINSNGRALLEKDTLEQKFLSKDFPVDVDSLKPEENFALQELLKRKDIVVKGLKKARIVSLTAAGKELLKQKIGRDFIESLTPAMLKTGAWKGKEFRRYDVKINVPAVNGGRVHFVSQAVDYIKRIWLDMGFKEMAGTLVQTAFWDLDALFVPQDHPAREMQDTFYIKEPRYGKLPEIAKTIKAVHENGWKTGSRGWQGSWSEKVARENLLRTHTTALSARTIAALKQEDLPAKFFSVNRVFRNEALSWKHLFEFIQVEGIVVDPDANLKHLKGYLKEFFAKMGFPDVRIRPAHFPYTEPSAEVDVLHPVKKEWIELGGSGIFRPEVSMPLLGKETPVLAWGLGMERTIMQYYGIKDIRDLYKNDLKQLRTIKQWMM